MLDNIYNRKCIYFDYIALSILYENDSQCRNYNIKYVDVSAVDTLAVVPRETLINTKCIYYVLSYH